MAKFVPVDIFDLVIFGGAGDLALRKLMPALYHRDLDGQLPVGSRIISIGRRPFSNDEFLNIVRDSLRARLTDSEYSVEFWQSFSQRLQYIATDAMDASNWQDLKTVLAGFEDRIRVFYLATAPKLFGPIASGLGQNGLINDEVRIVLEKPVGNDHASALAINNQVGEFTLTSDPRMPNISTAGPGIISRNGESGNLSYLFVPKGSNNNLHSIPFSK